MIRCIVRNCSAIFQILGSIPLKECDVETQIMAAACAKVKCSQSLSSTSETVKAIINDKPRVQALILASKLTLLPSQVESLRWVCHVCDYLMLTIKAL